MVFLSSEMETDRTSCRASTRTKLPPKPASVRSRTRGTDLNNAFIENTEKDPKRKSCRNVRLAKTSVNNSSRTHVSHMARLLRSFSSVAFSKNSSPSIFTDFESQKKVLVANMRAELAPKSANCRRESGSLSSASTDSGRGSTLDTSSSQTQSSPSNASLCSRADLEISDFSIPLGWNSNDYFRSREGGPSYSMFAVLKTKTNVIDSQIVGNIRRTDSDVSFDETFLFRNEPSDFVIQVQLFAVRDESLNNQHTISQLISRSLGRKFASTLNDDNRYGTVAASSISPMPNRNCEKSNFALIAESTLSIKHLSLETTIYDIRKLCADSSKTPPLYGNFRCRFAAKPKSLSKSLASGLVTIKALDQHRLLQNVSCRLQRGMFRCYINNSRHHNDVHEQTLLQLVVNEETKVKPSSEKRSFQLETITETGIERFVISTESEKLSNAWKHAFTVQVADCKIWGKFATSALVRNKPATFESAATLSRLAGIRLYDQIGIGTEAVKSSTVSKGSPYAHQSCQTAPAPRYRERPHLQDVFEAPYVKPYTYVLKLNVGDQDEILPQTCGATQLVQPQSFHQNLNLQKPKVANESSNFYVTPVTSVGSSTLPRFRAATVSNLPEVPQTVRSSSYFYDGYDYTQHTAKRERSTHSHRAEFRPLKELKKRLRKSLTNLIDRKVEVTKL